MEGLSMYLPPDRIDEILLFIANNAGSKSGVAFDYPFLSLNNGTDTSDTARNFRERVRELGEPLCFGIPKDGICPYLEERGFQKIRNMAPTEANARFFQEKILSGRCAPFSPLSMPRYLNNKSTR
jgi:O-methyltransferase involved in polyketide biosynthesis